MTMTHAEAIELISRVFDDSGAAESLARALIRISEDAVGALADGPAQEALEINAGREILACLNRCREHFDADDGADYSDLERGA